MHEAENRLKEKEDLVKSSSKLLSSSSRIAGSSSLLGSKEIFARNEEEDSVDSDLSMRGKVLHRWIGESREEETVEEDYEEDEEDKYYDNKHFEKKDCDIILESSEDSNDAPKQDEEEVIIDSSEDEGTSKELNFSWAAPTFNNRDRQTLTTDEEIARLINEEETIETASTSVNFNEDEELFVEELDQDNSIEINIDTPTESHPIEVEDSPVEGKATTKLIFSEESLAEEDEDDVIEIESDDEKQESQEPDVPTGKILFSSMFSSHDDEEEFPEDVQHDTPHDVEKDDYVTGNCDTCPILLREIKTGLSEIVPEGLQAFPYEAVPGAVEVETDVMEDTNPAGGALEQDEMRDLLDHVSTTATRASSIAGSLVDLETRAGSVTGEAGRPQSFTFSEPANTEAEENNKIQSEQVNFVFSQPLDTSQLGERQGEGEDGEEAGTAVISQQTQSREDLSEDSLKEDKDMEKDSSDESSEDDQEEEGVGLNFSWADIPESNVSINQIINDEISSLSFAAPLVESEAGSVEDCDDSKFEFPLPHDESISMEVEEDDSDLPVESDDRVVTSSAENELEFTSEKGNKEESKTDLSIPVEVEEKSIAELSQKVEEETPELATSTVDDQETQVKVDEVTEAESVQTPCQVEQPVTPLRRSSRKSSKDSSLTMTPTRKSSRKAKTPSKIEISSVEQDITTQLEAIEEENSRSSIELKAQPEEKVSTQSGRISSRKKSSSTNVSSHKEEISQEDVMKQKLSASLTPATPVRRSRRLSGATPVLTPVLPSRGRRVSGALRTSNTPTITETDEKQEKFDTDVEVIEANSNSPQGDESPSTPRRSSRVSKSSIGDQSPNTPKRNKSSRGGKSPTTPKRSNRVSKSSREDQSPITPRRSSRSSRKVDISLEEVDLKTPLTPETISAIPKHLTPLKQATPLKEDAKTPTRRTRRVSTSDASSDQPLTPVRRSRRLSGVSVELSSAPDGGLISGATPRRTPRSKRHNTSVKAEDVETALATSAGSITPLPTLVEDVETDDSEAPTEDPPPKRGRGRGSKSTAVASLDVISEEGASEVPSKSAKASTSRGKRKQMEEDEVEATPPAKRRSRRVTITVLDTDVDLLGSPHVTSNAGERRKSASSVTTKRKKYIPVKKKTSVRIK